MGLAIAESIAVADDLRLASVWLRDASAEGRFAEAHGGLFSSDIDAVVRAADVLIDFSLPQATATVVAAVARHERPLVCGVSGLSIEQQSLLERAAGTVAIVYDRNMSLGIAVLDAIVRRAAAALGPEFAVAIHETHHIHKLDAPSGTALQLGEAVAAARGADPDTIDYKVERRGEVPGDHAVVFTSANEQLTLQHSVTTRQVFAEGALRAARWILDQPPGQYSMRDVLADDCL